MMFTLSDIAGVTVATVLAVPVLLLPGYALAALSNAFGFRDEAPLRRHMLGLLVAYAVLPVLYSMIARFAGLHAALGVALGLAGMACWLGGAALVPRLSRGAWLGLGAALAALIFFWIDLAWGGRLYPTLLSIDLVKHAATVRALVEQGSAPPLDPFFLRAQPISYYYFYYTPSALIDVLGGDLVDARAAVGGQAFWTGVALIGLLIVLAERSGLLRPGERAPVPFLLLLMAAGSLQILVVVILSGVFRLPWPAQLGWYSDEMTSWPLSILWVPHHVAALLASWVGFLALIEAQRRGLKDSIVHVVLAGFAFASACGLSTWVTMGAVATVAVWAVADLWARRWRHVALLGASGVVALIVALPHLLDLSAYRSYGDFPLGFKVRMFVFADLISEMLGGVLADGIRLLFLPLTYLVAGGICCLGTIAFWRKQSLARVHENETARVITFSAAATFVIGSFIASVIVNNDLGWRVVLFLQLSALLWTMSVLMPVWRRAERIGAFQALPRVLPVRAAVFIGIGLAGVAHELAAVRGFQALGLWTGKVVSHPFIDHEQRQAYAWLALNAAPDLVIQHNPDTGRALGFGLYGRHRTAIADRHNAILFGPSASDVKLRLEALKPVFAEARSSEEVRRVLAAHGIDAVVVTAADPIWKTRPAWLIATTPLFATTHVRVLNTRDLKDQP